MKIGTGNDSSIFPPWVQLGLSSTVLHVPPTATGAKLQTIPVRGDVIWNVVSLSILVLRLNGTSSESNGSISLLLWQVTSTTLVVHTVLCTLAPQLQRASLTCIEGLRTRAPLRSWLLKSQKGRVLPTTKEAQLGILIRNICTSSINNPVCQLRNAGNFWHASQPFIVHAGIPTICWQCYDYIYITCATVRVPIQVP